MAALAEAEESESGERRENESGERKRETTGEGTRESASPLLSRRLSRDRNTDETSPGRG
jgi:hypothetical protein